MQRLKKYSGGGSSTNAGTDIANDDSCIILPPSHLINNIVSTSGNLHPLNANGGNSNKSRGEFGSRTGCGFGDISYSQGVRMERDSEGMNDNNNASDERSALSSNLNNLNVPANNDSSATNLMLSSYLRS